jgi:hypothetical protein
MSAGSPHERRTEPRLSPRLPIAVVFRGAAGTVEETAVLRDLSLHGMYLRTPRPAAYGAEVRARFLLGGTRASMAEGRIVRTERGLGLGIEFVRVGDSLRVALAELVASGSPARGAIDAQVEILG